MTRVLVVSEDTRYLKRAVERLREAGLDATSACSASAGRLMLEGETYDVVAAAEFVDGEPFDSVVDALEPDASLVRPGGPDELEELPDRVRAATADRSANR